MAIQNYDKEFEYEQDDLPDLMVGIDLDLNWQSAEPDVGIMSAYAEVNDYDLYIDGVKIEWRKMPPPIGTEPVLDAFNILDKEAFMAEVGNAIDTYLEDAEPPEPYDYDDR